MTSALEAGPTGDQAPSAAPTRAGRARLLSPRRFRAAGGIAAQGSQALASFALQVLAARLLGMEGLGRYAALYAVIVLCTAVVSGLVGDSLTVLDRRQAAIRTGLQTWLLVTSASLAVLAGLSTWAAGFLDAATAVVFAAATAVFLLMDTLRRLLMANLLFWRIVVVDLAALAVAVGVLLLASESGPIRLVHFLTALVLGQVGALVTAVALLPAADRHLAPWRPAGLKPVARYGVWRALQQLVRPALLSSVRFAGIALVSVAAVGELEAARIYVAPAMLLVGGISSVLFAGYALERTSALAVLVPRTDRTVALLILAVAVIGLAFVLALPWLGQLVTGGAYDVPRVAVIGWACFAAAVAAGTPYGALAAVRGRQAAVLAVRVGESVASLAAVLALVVLQGSMDWVPLVLAAGSLLGGVVIRMALLAPMVRGEGAEPWPAR